LTIFSSYSWFNEISNVVNRNIPFIVITGIVLFLWAIWKICGIAYNSENKKIALALILLIITPTMVMYILMEVKGYVGDIVVATVLFATLIAILVYTWKTWQLKNLTAKEITYIIRPFIIFKNDRNFYFKNLGNGIAQNIKMEDIPIENLKFKGEKKAPLSYIVKYINFTYVGCLEKEKMEGEQIKLKIYNRENKEIINKKTIYMTIENRVKNSLNFMPNFKIKITYEDVEGTEYTTYMAVKDDMLQVVKETTYNQCG